MGPDDARAALERYPLVDALRERRSRRFGLGMVMPAGPLAYRSRHPGLPLTEGEEARLAFAACGITGPALADLAYAPGQGGTIMAGLLGRTSGSGDAVQSVAVFVINAAATYLLLLQNLGLMAQALGLGGFPHWAAHPFGWLRALGFRTQEIPASRYLGMSRPLRWASRLLGRDVGVSLALGLEQDGRPLLVPYRPPYHASMEAAVRAVVELKFGAEGVFRRGAGTGAWREPERVANVATTPSPAAVDATIAYATYVWERYGRFPAYAPPFRTVLGFQASHVDVEFYDRYYRPEALSATQREHLARWHGGPAGSDAPAGS